MSKKKILGILILFFAGAWVVYDLNLVPQYTGLVNSGLSFLLGGYVASPGGIVTLASGITAVAGVAKLAWNRTKSGMEGMYSTAIGEKDRQLTNLSNAYGEAKASAETWEGQANSYKASWETAQKTLEARDKELSAIKLELQRKQIEVNVATQVKATELHMVKEKVSVQKIMETAGATAQEAKAAIEKMGRIPTVE